MIDPIPDSDSDWLISVIVPAHNSEATLAETLESIARQRHRQLEILIVDDGSSDGTAALAAQFCEVEPRARLIVQANAGVAAARNTGLQHARGGYVAPIDGDDVWHPDHLAGLVAAMRQSPARYGFIAARHRQIDKRSRVVGSSPPIRRRGTAVDALLLHNFVGNGSALLVDRSAALEAGGYDERLRQAGLEGCEDYLLQLRIAASRPVAVVDSFTVGYRRLASSMSSNIGRLIGSERLAVAMFLSERNITSGPPRHWRARQARLITRNHWGMGKRLRAAAALSRAFALDFTGTASAMLTYLLLIVSGRHDESQRRPFDAVDPHEALDVPIDRARRTVSRWMHRHGAGDRVGLQPALLTVDAERRSGGS